MIPKVDIIAWRRFSHWVNDAQVEQDLLISRALVTMFQSPCCWPTPHTLSMKRIIL